MVKIFLDDERQAPEGWIRTFSVMETISYLETGEVEEISLDHDLGDDGCIGTGYDVVLWIEEQVVLHGFNPPIIHVHSANSSARDKMLAGVESIKRFASQHRRTD